MPFPFIETIVRLIVPLSIFKFPKLGILFSILTDLYDWKFVHVTNDAELAFYQNWDKTMDIYYLVIIFLVIFKFKDKIFKKTALFLFIYRIAGLVFFYLTHNRSFLLYFPNVFENFVIFYLVYIWYSKDQILFKSKKVLLVVLSALLLPKLIHEYLMHVLIKQPWELYDVGKILGFGGILQEYTNYLVYGTLLYFIPFTLSLIVCKKLNRNKRKLHY